MGSWTDKGSASKAGTKRATGQLGRRRISKQSRNEESNWTAVDQQAKEERRENWTTGQTPDQQAKEERREQLDSCPIEEIASSRIRLRSALFSREFEVLESRPILTPASIRVPILNMWHYRLERQGISKFVCQGPLYFRSCFRKVKPCSHQVVAGSPGAIPDPRAIVKDTTHRVRTMIRKPNNGDQQEGKDIK